MRHWSWYTPAPKQPVPEDGLQVDRFGSTWWGKQWMRALERLGYAYANRLPRGRSYARSGRVVNLVMGSGEATAGVVGTRRDPYSVQIKLKTFPKKSWQRIVEILASRARYSVALLRGEIPPEIGTALSDHGLDLFPVSGRDLDTSCSCPDWANPCKHVAAVHYVVAAALDADPFLIFVLRGLDRQALLSALAAARGSSKPPPKAQEAASPPEPMWEAPDEMDEELYLAGDGPLPQLTFRVEPAAVDLAGLARLGPPPPVLQDLPKRLGPSIRAAARAALALARSGDPLVNGASPGDQDTVRDRVVDFIRRCPDGATMLLLRSRLPDGKNDLQRAVRSLRKEGLLTHTGQGAATRYTLARASAAQKTGHQETQEMAARPRWPRRRKRVGDAQVPAPGGQARSTEAPLGEAITTVLLAAGEPLPMREIARRLERPVNSRLRQALTALRSEGIVVMVGRRRNARYTLESSRT